MSEVFALRNSIDEVMRSSSGGAFIAICRCFERMNVNENIAFYGVTYDSDINVIHDRVERAEDCKKFQGSKYVKSKFDGIFEKIANDLNNGYYVVFSGTPCQVYSVIKFVEMKKLDLDKLFTIDVICHGTPKIEVWNDYKFWLENKKNSKLSEYSFRFKKEGWKAYPAYAKFKDNSSLTNTAETSIFSELHMKGYSINKGCFKCAFSNEKRNSDITLGDYWGIEKIDKNIYDKNGVSLILSNSTKGKKLIDNLFKEKNVILKRTFGTDYLNYQWNLKHNTEIPNDYDEFWKDYRNFGFEFVLKKYLNFGNKYKIKFYFKKLIRKTKLIDYYRSLKNRKGILK